MKLAEFLSNVKNRRIRPKTCELLNQMSLTLN